MVLRGDIRIDDLLSFAFGPDFGRPRRLHSLESRRYPCCIRWGGCRRHREGSRIDGRPEGLLGFAWRGDSSPGSWHSREGDNSPHRTPPGCRYYLEDTGSNMSRPHPLPRFVWSCLGQSAMLGHLFMFLAFLNVIPFERVNATDSKLL